MTFPSLPCEKGSLVIGLGLDLCSSPIGEIISGQ